MRQRLFNTNFMNALTSFLACLAALLLALFAWSLWGQWRIERSHPPTGRFITVQGVRLHYVEVGEGPPVVLVHGASSNLNEFTRSLMPALATRFRVIAFDRPGYGYSERPDESDGWLDPGRLADLLLSAAETLGAERPLLLGHSWGGSVVMAAQVNHPDRIAGGVMLSGVAGHWAGPLGWTYQLGEIPVLGPLFAWTLVYPLGQFLLEDGVREVLAPATPAPGHLERTAVALALRPGSYLTNVRDTNSLSEYLQLLSPRYDTIRHPLLLIHGEADNLVPWWNHGRRVLPVVAHSEAVLLPDAGHAPHHSHTREVADQIVRFYTRLLARHETPAPRLAQCLP